LDHPHFSLDTSNFNGYLIQGVLNDVLVHDYQARLKAFRELKNLLGSPYNLVSTASLKLDIRTINLIGGSSLCMCVEFILSSG
jgi:hypothetical protein